MPCIANSESRCAETPPNASRTTVTASDTVVTGLTKVVSVVASLGVGIVRYTEPDQTAGMPAGAPG